MKRINNAILVFDRDVEATELEPLLKDFEGDVIINGTLMIDDAIRITCDNLYVENIDSYVYCDVELIGNLIIRGYGCFCNISVNGSIYSGGYINSHRINVAEDVHSRGGINAGGHDICVGGSLISNASIKARSIKVLNDIEVIE